MLNPAKLALAMAISLSSAVGLGATYYIGPTGNDANAGTSESSAWRTVAHLGALKFGPDDRILFAGGHTFVGPIRIKNVAHPLLISSYGEGVATIDGASGDGISVEDAKGLRIERLKLVAAGRKANDGRGISLQNCADAKIANVDVSGFRLSGVEILGCSDSTLEQVHAHDNGSSGIGVGGGYDQVPRSKNIVIRHCRAINNPGDPKNLSNHSGNGIVVGGVDGCLIEYCEAAENGWDMPRTGNGPVGIWAWNASKVVIQHCISHDNKSPGTDGGGFDFDGGVTESLMEFNLSYNNAGTGYLLCQYEEGGDWRDNIIRDNISYEDGKLNFNSGIALFTPPEMHNMQGCLVERNTIINSRHAIATMGDVPGLVYRNNVFVSGEDMFHLAWGHGGYKHSDFAENLAWSVHGEKGMKGEVSPFATIADWKNTGGHFAEPNLLLPKSVRELPTNPDELKNMKWFTPLPGSPCLRNGKQVFGAQIGG